VKKLSVARCDFSEEVSQDSALGLGQRFEGLVDRLDDIRQERFAAALSAWGYHHIDAPTITGITATRYAALLFELVEQA
jgi:hypothetical protein